MLVVRIEHKGDGNGIFHLRGSFRLITALPSFFNRHNDFPNPTAEGLNLYKDNKEWFCAFATMDIFNQWVTDEEKHFFINNGFNIILLEVDEIQVGNFQVLYTKESVKSCKIINPLF